jgi:hypothetical protein
VLTDGGQSDDDKYVVFAKETIVGKMVGDYRRDERDTTYNRSEHLGRGVTERGDWKSGKPGPSAPVDPESHAALWIAIAAFALAAFGVAAAFFARAIH